MINKRLIRALLLMYLLVILEFCFATEQLRLLNNYVRFAPPAQQALDLFKQSPPDA